MFKITNHSWDGDRTLVFFLWYFLFNAFLQFAPKGDAEPCINFDRTPSFDPITKCMKIVYIAEKEELQALIKECIHEQLEAFMKEINKSPLRNALTLLNQQNILELVKPHCTN